MCESMSCKNSWTRNYVMSAGRFPKPRACGCWAVFNFCRESSDHGPFNSWDRVPFLTDVATPGTPSLTPLYNEIYSNFFIANYESSMCVDNDDGSAYYKIHDNVCHGGGHKSDFAGHSKSTYNSLEIGPKRDACISVQPSLDNVREGYWNNTCLQLLPVQNATGQGPYATVNGCNGTTGAVQDPKALPVMHANTIYNAFGQAYVQCVQATPPFPRATMTLQEFQAQGYEGGTRVEKLPTVDSIIRLAKTTLGMP
eukprot:m.937263 g.937263  ORF g.937263 m.937263 type:complete len:254 (-) comp23814_c0_seq3:1177-1938(-)